MENILVDIVIYLAIGVAIGIGMVGIYVWFFLYLPIKSRIDRMIREVVDEAAADIVGLSIEVDQGQYFCYNIEDKQFVCQGKTVAEIKEAFGKRFPGKTAYIASGDPAVVEQFQTELSQLRTNENNSSI